MTYPIGTICSPSLLYQIADSWKGEIPPYQSNRTYHETVIGNGRARAASSGPPVTRPLSWRRGKSGLWCCNITSSNTKFTVQVLHIATFWAEHGSSNGLVQYREATQLHYGIIKWGISLYGGICLARIEGCFRSAMNVAEDIQIHALL